MQGGVNELIGHFGPIELCGVDVIDAGFDGVAQNSDGAFAIFGGTKDSGARELHGPETHALNGMVGKQGGFTGHDLYLASTSEGRLKTACLEQLLAHRPQPGRLLVAAGVLAHVTRSAPDPVLTRLAGNLN